MDRKAPAGGFSAEHLDSAEVICVDRSADACTDPREDACIRARRRDASTLAVIASDLGGVTLCHDRRTRGGKQWRRLSM